MEPIKFQNWQNLDLRVGKIEEVENFQGTDKLYKISIDLGKNLGKRTLIAGLKPYYKQQELIGKNCIVFTNLESKKIRGIESSGMILAAVNEDESKVQILQPDKEIEIGSKIR